MRRVALLPEPRSRRGGRMPRAFATRCVKGASASVRSGPTRNSDVTLATLHRSAGLGWHIRTVHSRGFGASAARAPSLRSRETVKSNSGPGRQCYSLLDATVRH